MYKLVIIKNHNKYDADFYLIDENGTSVTYVTYDGGEEIELQYLDSSKSPVLDRDKSKILLKLWSKMFLGKRDNNMIKYQCALFDLDNFKLLKHWNMSDN